MRWRQIDRRSYVLIFNTGYELAKGLKDFATEHNLADASFKAIGALASVKLPWFNPETKKYQTSVDLKEQVELLSSDWRCCQVRWQAHRACTCCRRPVRRHNCRRSLAGSVCTAHMRSVFD